jgi:hypothetical protein
MGLCARRQLGKTIKTQIQSTHIGFAKTIWLPLLWIELPMKQPIVLPIEYLIVLLIDNGY